MPSPRRSGFTLVEVLVATAVLAIGLLAALTAFSMAARITGASNSDTTVSLLAQQKLSEVLAQDPRRLQPGRLTGDFAPARPEYSWELTLHQPDALRVMRVDLLIRAPEGGKKREFRFSTEVF